MKLASELHKRSTGKSFLHSDDVTTGSIAEDIARLLKSLGSLCRRWQYSPRYRAQSRCY